MRHVKLFLTDGSGIMTKNQTLHYYNGELDNYPVKDDRHLLKILATATDGAIAIIDPRLEKLTYFSPLQILDLIPMRSIAKARVINN